jgi:hypothetical protein
MSRSLAAPQAARLALDLSEVLRPPLVAAWGDRLVGRALAHADRSLPAPPLLAWRAARVLGVDGVKARRWMLACTLFYGAADLLDDADDGDLGSGDPKIARAAAIEMLFVSQSVLARLTPRGALVSRFAAEGARMSSGQHADLEFTDRLEPEPPPLIARSKGGAEFAAFFGGAATLAGVAAAPWDGFGRSLGEALQILSDFDDLLGTASRDLAAAKPSVALRPPGADAAARYRAHALTIGGRRCSQFARAQLWMGRGDERLREALDASLRGLRAHAAHPFLSTLAEHVDALARQRISLLRGRDARPARTVPLSVAMQPAAAAARAFLSEGLAHGGLDEVCRHGLFGAPEVRGNVFGPLFLGSLLSGDPTLQTAAQAALGRADPDGWRYYPGRGEIPPDADDNGLALQAWARQQALTHERVPPREVSRAAALLRANRRDDGLFWTWLAPSPAARAEIATRWAGERCLVSSAQALLGLWRTRDGDERDETLRGLRTLCASLREEPPPSAFYAPPFVDALTLPIMLELARDLEVADAPWCIDARGATVGRICARRRSDSSFGSTLETALAARALVTSAAPLDAPEAIALALLAAQAADGGFASDPLFATVPHAVTRAHGSRALTTGAVLAALDALRTIAAQAAVPVSAEAVEVALPPRVEGA